MSLISIKSNQNLTIATVTKTIGFRTICFDQRPITSAEIDQGIGPGNRWNFEAKGHEIYCKGSNFVPPDVSWPRVTKERMEDLFESVIVSTQNMLRIWDGAFALLDGFCQWPMRWASSCGTTLNSPTPLTQPLQTS